MTEAIYTPKGPKFYDNATGRKMILADTSEPRRDLIGWLFYKHPDGQWVSLRKATESDRILIYGAIFKEHHRDEQ